MVGEDGHLHTEQRCGDGGAEQGLVARVVGMGDHRDAAGQQLWSRRVDDQIALPVHAMERELVVGARYLTVFHLGLRHGGAFVDVVQRGGVLLVGLAALEVAQERELAGAARTGADGGVQQAPVDRQTEPAEQLLEDLFVDVGDLSA